MPRLSLTDFVDIVAKAGTQKATKITQLKNRDKYEPAFDFYKQLREHIVSAHSEGKGKASLGSILPALKDPKKRKIYPAIIRGHVKWWGRKTLGWFNP